MQCKSKTKAGKRCKANAYIDGKCIFHMRVGGGKGRKTTTYARSRRDAKKYQRRKS